jgi:uncharacterized damage-inducible protein DinB
MHVLGGDGLISRDTFLNLFAYNYWARDRQLKACAALTEEQFRRPIVSSFPSVQATLAHMVEAEWVWSERWYGRSPTNHEAEEFVPERFPTLNSVKSAGVRLSSLCAATLMP